MTQNNNTMTAEQKLGAVLSEIAGRREEIESVLPPDIAFDKFHATINQALRTNPDILKCYGPSIVNACIKAAYDGLNLDGREAALVVANEKYQKNPDRYRDVARYMPMVFGLRKQILQSNLIEDVFTALVYSNEPFRVIGGVNRDLFHEPIIDSATRGALVAVYSVAVFKTGYRTFEVMTKAEVMEIKAVAATKKVWEKWEAEMWRKSVLRRHRKALPSTRDIVDMEAQEMFPQFAGNDQPALAAPAPRPTRGQTALAAPAQTFDYDLGGNDTREHQVVDNQTKGQEDQQAQRQETKVTVDQSEQPKSNLPVGGDEWAQWEADLGKKIAACTKIEECNALCSRVRDDLAAEQGAMSDDIAILFTDRLAELATDDGAGTAAASVQDNRAVETTS